MVQKTCYIRLDESARLIAAQYSHEGTNPMAFAAPADKCELTTPGIWIATKWVKQGKTPVEGRVLIPWRYVVDVFEYDDPNDPPVGTALLDV